MRVRSGLLPVLVALAVVVPACSSDGSPGSSPVDGGRSTLVDAATGTTGGEDASVLDPGDAATSTSAYHAAVIADGPVAYWRFEEKAGTIAKDEVGNAHPGLYFGGTTLGGAGIEAGGSAVKLDGTSGCIGVGPYFRFAGRVTFSVEGWVNASSYGASGTRVVSTEGFPTGIRSGWNLSATWRA